MIRVVIVQELLAHYRTEFYERLRTALEKEGVYLELVHGAASGKRAARKDEATLPWATVVNNWSIRLSGSRHIVWQPAIGNVLRSDLTIVEQANKHILNYLLALPIPK